MTDIFLQQHRHNPEGCSCCGPNQHYAVASSDDDSSGNNNNNQANDNDMATIAKEMNELSVQERVQVLEELHLIFVDWMMS